MRREKVLDWLGTGTLAACVLVLCAGVLAGCGSTRDFYRQPAMDAETVTPVQTAKKVLQHHNVIGVQIVALKNDPTVSARSKTILVDAYRQSVCSDLERDTGVDTPECRKGPAWRAEGAIAAYEGLVTAETEAELQAASDALFRELSNLIDLISKAR